MFFPEIPPRLDASVVIVAKIAVQKIKNLVDHGGIGQRKGRTDNATVIVGFLYLGERPLDPQHLFVFVIQFHQIGDDALIES